MTAPRPEAPTGADLVDAIRRTAVPRGVSATVFCRPLTSNPSAWLAMLVRAERPTAATCARVAALLADEPIPPKLSDSFDRSEPALENDPPAEPSAESPSGRDLGTAIRRAAGDRGLRIAEFIGTDATDAHTRLRNLEQARRPKPATIAKVAALLATPIAPHGAPIARPTARPNLARPNLARKYNGPPPPGPSYDREPCRLCGVRGDIGCVHYPREIRA